MLPKYRNRSTPVILDSGPFLLLLIGLYDSRMIGEAKRIKDYKPIHFNILIQFLAGRKIFITPDVLAEVSNLSKIVVNKDRILEFFKTIIPEFQQINEYTTSKDIIIGGS